jgi:hypothetical protein
MANNCESILFDRKAVISPPWANPPTSSGERNDNHHFQTLLGRHSSGLDIPQSYEPAITRMVSTERGQKTLYPKT